MKVLVCGAAGFIGGHIARALEAAGHEVVRGSRAPARWRSECQVDFSLDVDIDTWTRRLEGVQAVVNAVGVLRDSRQRPMRRVHDEVPRALFAACAKAGAVRVIHVSALGIARAASSYAVTKRAAEQALLARTAVGELQGVVLRPSVVYGPGGATSAFYDRLAAMPWLLLPGPVLAARVQPMRVEDLAEMVVRLLGPHANLTGVIHCVGPRSDTLAGFIAGLRARRGRPPARVWALPETLTRLSVRLGDLLPVTPWGSEALALLRTDNVAPVGPCAALLGRTPGDPLAPTFRAIESPRAA